MRVTDDVQSSKPATQFFGKSRTGYRNEKRDEDRGDHECDRWENGVVLNLVQDSAPHRELRCSVTDPAMLKRRLVILKAAALDQPRLQRWTDAAIERDGGR